MAPKELKMPRPNPKQALALREQHRYVGYGGARGGGKSWFVRWKATLLALHYSGIKILITRKTYRELLNNHIVPLQGMLSGIATYNKSDKCFQFPNGSSIWFGYCAADSDLDQYQLDPIEFTIDVPLSPIYLLNPTTLRAEVGV